MNGIEEILKEQVNINKVRDIIMKEFAKADRELYEACSNQGKSRTKIEIAQEKLKLCSRMLLEVTKLEQRRTTS